MEESPGLHKKKPTERVFVHEVFDRKVWWPKVFLQMCRRGSPNQVMAKDGANTVRKFEQERLAKQAKEKKKLDKQKEVAKKQNDSKKNRTTSSNKKKRKVTSNGETSTGKRKRSS